MSCRLPTLINLSQNSRAHNVYILLGEGHPVHRQILPGREALRPVQFQRIREDGLDQRGGRRVRGPDLRRKGAAGGRQCAGVWILLSEEDGGPGAGAPGRDGHGAAGHGRQGGFKGLLKAGDAGPESDAFKI